MNGKSQLTNNGIEKLLKMANVNKEEYIDMYFMLTDSKILNKQNNLYICKLRDNNSTYEKFILKSNSKIINDSIIHVTKIRITLVGNNKIISCLNYQNYGKMDDEEEKKDDLQNKIEKEKKMLEEELNENTKLLLGNLKHAKKKAKQFFKWDNGNLILVDKSNKIVPNEIKEKEISDENSPKKENKLPDRKDYNINNIDNRDNIDNSYDSSILHENENKININKEDEDEKEIENLFKNINIDELYKNNQKITDINDQYQLIINLTTSEKGKTFYTKCINRALIDKDNQKYILYIFRDTEGAEINAYAYGNDIENIYKKIEQNKCYTITNYIIKPKISSGFINCDYRLILNNETNIQPMPPDPIFNQTNFRFLSIEELFFFKKGTVIDICGIIYDEGKIEPVKTINGIKCVRNILICDTSKKKIYISLWEPHCTNKRINFEKGEIIAIKYCKVFLFPEKIKKLSTMTISILQNSTGNYEKDKSLKDFYKEYKTADNFCLVLIPPEFHYVEKLKSIIDYNIKNNVKNCNISFVTKGYVADIAIDNKCIYKGCHFCQKSLKEIKEKNNLKYNCIKCKKIFEKPKYLFRLEFKIKDALSTMRCKMIGDIAEKFLGIRPDIIYKYLEEDNFLELRKIGEKVRFHEYIFIGNLQTNECGNKLYNNARIYNFEKAEGDNLKKVFELIGEE